MNGVGSEPIVTRTLTGALLDGDVYGASSRGERHSVRSHSDMDSGASQGTDPGREDHILLVPPMFLEFPVLLTLLWMLVLLSMLSPSLRLLQALAPSCQMAATQMPLCRTSIWMTVTVSFRYCRDENSCCCHI